MGFGKFSRAGQGPAARHMHKGGYDGNDAPGEPHHDAGINNAAPGLRELTHSDDNRHDARVHGPRHDEAPARRMEERHAKERSENHVQEFGVLGEVTGPRNHPGCHLQLKRPVALAVGIKENGSAVEPPLPAVETSVGDGLPGQRGQTNHGLTQDEHETKDAPKGGRMSDATGGHSRY